LFKYSEYARQTKLLIQRIISQYATQTQNIEAPISEINNANIVVFSFEDKLFLKTLLITKRRETVSFATLKAPGLCNRIQAYTENKKYNHYTFK